MAKLTGWSKAELEDLLEEEFATYLDLAMKAFGCKEETLEGAPPPDFEDPAVLQRIQDLVSQAKGRQA